MTEEEIKRTEELVNGWIATSADVIMEEMDIKEAKESGAMGVFDDRYLSRVKVYSIGEISKEICGGPHVTNIGKLGKFRIIKEESASAGIRRIKATLE